MSRKGATGGGGAMIKATLDLEMDLKQTKNALMLMSRQAKSTIMMVENIHKAAEKAKEQASVESAKKVVDTHRKTQQEIGKHVKKTTDEVEKEIKKSSQFMTSFGKNMRKQLKNSFGYLARIQPYMQAFRKGMRQAERVVRAVLGAVMELGRKFHEVSKAVIGDVGRIVRSVFSLLRVMQLTATQITGFLEELTKKLVFLQLDIRYIISQTKNMTLAITAMIGASIYNFTRFEEAFVKVVRVVNMTDRELKELSETLRRMSTQTITSADALAEIAAVAGRLGIHAKDDIITFTETVSMLAEATDVVGETGATQLARLMTVMGENVQTVDRLASSIVHLGNMFPAMESEMMTMAFRLSGAASTMGMMSHEVMGLSTALVSVGVEAERGGTALSRVMIEMASAAAAGGKEMRDYARLAGVSMNEYARIISEEPVRAVELFIQGLQRMHDAGEDVFQVLDDFGIQQIRTRDALLRLLSAGELVSSTVRESSRAYEENNALQEEFGRRMETVVAQATKLWNGIKELTMMFAQFYTGPIRDLIAGLNEIVQAAIKLDTEAYEPLVRFANAVMMMAGVTFLILIAARALLVLGVSATLLARFLFVVIPAIWMLSQLLKALGALEDYLQEEGITNPLETLIGVFERFRDAIRGLWDTFKESDLAKDWVQNFRDFFSDFLILIDDDDIEGIEFFVDFATLAVDLMANLIESLTNALRGIDVSEMDEDLRESLEALSEAVIRLFSESVTLIFGALPELLADVLEKIYEETDWESLWERMKDFGSDMWAGFKESTKDKGPAGIISHLLASWFVGAGFGAIGLPGIGKALQLPLEIGIRVAAMGALAVLFAVAKLVGGLLALGLTFPLPALTIAFAISSVFEGDEDGEGALGTLQDTIAGLIDGSVEVSEATVTIGKLVLDVVKAIPGTLYEGMTEFARFAWKLLWGKGDEFETERPLSILIGVILSLKILEIGIAAGAPVLGSWLIKTLAGAAAIQYLYLKIGLKMVAGQAFAKAFATAGAFWAAILAPAIAKHAGPMFSVVGPWGIAVAGTALAFYLAFKFIPDFELPSFLTKEFWLEIGEDIQEAIDTIKEIDFKFWSDWELPSFLTSEFWVGVYEDIQEGMESIRELDTDFGLKFWSDWELPSFLTKQFWVDLAEDIENAIEVIGDIDFKFWSDWELPIFLTKEFWFGIDEDVQEGLENVKKIEIDFIGDWELPRVFTAEFWVELGKDIDAAIDTIRGIDFKFWSDWELPDWLTLEYWKELLKPISDVINLFRPSEWEWPSLPNFLTFSYWQMLGQEIRKALDMSDAFSEYMRHLPIRGIPSQTLDTGHSLDWGSAAGFSSGALLPGYGGGDRIPALLEAGEAVVPKDVVRGGLGAIVGWFRSIGAVKMAGGGMARGAPGGTSVKASGDGVAVTIDMKAQEWLESTEGIRDEISSVFAYLRDGDYGGMLDSMLDILDMVANYLFSGLRNLINTVIDALIGWFPQFGETLEGIRDVALSGISAIEGLGRLMETEPEEWQPTHGLLPPGGYQVDYPHPQPPAEILGAFLQDVFMKPFEAFADFIEDGMELLELFRDYRAGYVDAAVQIEQALITFLEDLKIEMGGAFGLRGGDGGGMGEGLAMVLGDVAGLVDAVMAAETAIGGIIAIIIQLIPRMESLSVLTGHLADLLNLVAEVLNPFLNILSSTVAVLMYGLAPVIDYLARAMDTYGMMMFSLLFPKIQGLAMLLLGLMIVVQWVQISMAEVSLGIAKFLNTLPLVGGAFDDLVDSLQEYRDGERERLDELTDSWEELIDLTLEDAWALGKHTDEVKKATDAMSNVPDIFRGALRLSSGGASGWWDDDDGSGLPPIPGIGFPGLPGGRVGDDDPRLTSHTEEVHIHFHGEVYGMDDFDRRVNQAVDEMSVRRNRRYSGKSMGRW